MLFLHHIDSHKLGFASFDADGKGEPNEMVGFDGDDESHRIPIRKKKNTPEKTNASIATENLPC